MSPGFWKQIPGFFDFHNVYDAAVANAVDGDVFVEVGVFLGRSITYLAEKVATSGKYIRIIGIDQWFMTARWQKLVEEQLNNGACDAWEELVKRSEHAGYPNMYLACKSFIQESGYSDNIELVRSGSQVYANVFNNKSLSFVFIDGDTSFSGTLADVRNYWPKIKLGGTLAGHNYNKKHPTVVNAVNKAFSNNRRVSVVKVEPSAWSVKKS